MSCLIKTLGNYGLLPSSKYSSLSIPNNENNKNSISIFREIITGNIFLYMVQKIYIHNNHLMSFNKLNLRLR